jgi:mono/diheme cytochrome c family protein
METSTVIRPRCRWPLAVSVAAAFGISAYAAAAGTTVWDKVYTAEQAKRGEEVYAKQCTSCHKDDLLGDNDYSQPLIGPQFLGKWNNKTVGDLYERTRTTMPANEPDTLKPQEYVDVVSYLLSVNSFPAGQTELPAELAKLKLITLLEARPK